MKSPIRSVAPASPAAQAKVSNDHSRTRVRPPNPFHRAMGRRKSSPARSAIRAAATFSAQPARQRSGTVVIASPPSAFIEKTPSAKRCGPPSGGKGAAPLPVPSPRASAMPSPHAPTIGPAARPVKAACAARIAPCASARFGE